VLSYKPEIADRETEKLRKGETRYQDGLAAEKAGDMKGAVKAYIDSARLGHPLADLRLGQLYDKDNSKTLPRDLQESITHYQKAREFGIDPVRSFVVGDRWLDVALGRAVGAQSVLVRTGYGASEEEKQPGGLAADAVVDNLIAASSWILGRL